MNNHHKNSHRGTHSYYFSGEKANATEPAQMPDSTISASYVEGAEFWIGTTVGRTVFLARDGDFITNFGICSPSCSKQGVFSTRGSSVAYRTSATSLSFISDIIFADIDSNTVTEINDVPVSFIERVVILSNKTVLVVGDQGEVIIYDSNGDLITKSDPIEESKAAIITHVEVSSDTKWLFLGVHSMETEKATIVVFHISKSNDIDKKYSLELDGDYKGTLEQSIGALDAGLVFAGRTILLLSKAHGTSISSDSETIYEGPVEVYGVDDDGQLHSLKTLSVQYTECPSIKGDGNRRAFLINGNDNLHLIEVKDAPND